MTFESKDRHGVHAEPLKDNIIKSSRRIFFTYDINYLDEDAYQYDNMTYSCGGTGVLIKYNERFFLLTATHVLIENGCLPEHQSDSPFFIHVLANGNINERADRLYPIRAWWIGELINQNLDGVEANDLVLVELSFVVLKFPDRFIDLDKKKHAKSVHANHMFNGMRLLASGFPVIDNEINYEEGGRTNLCRLIVSGVFFKEKHSFCMVLDHKLSHKELNGMSGGVVSNVIQKSRQTQWAGMIQRGGNGRITFCPACYIVPAIKEYWKASYCNLDPSTQLNFLDKELSIDGINGRKRLNQIAKRQTAKMGMVKNA